MKKNLVIFGAVIILFSCGGYTEDQSKAAEEFCNCMAQEAYDDFFINFYECDLQVNEKYPGETFSDDGWSLALEETCPSIAGEIAESN